MFINAPQAYSKTTAPATAIATTYNVAFTSPSTPASLAADEYPHGNGYGILTVSGTDGAAKLVGVLADGTAYSSSAYLCKTTPATVPIFASFASRLGSIVGTATIDQSQATTDVTATGIRWFRSANTAAQYYPYGYAYDTDTGLTVNLIGAKQSTSTLPTFSATTNVDFTLGSFASSPVMAKVIGAGLASTDKTTKLAFKATTNVLSGSYTPVGGNANVIGGIAVGKASTTVYGYILSPLPKHTDGTGEGGLVTLHP
jgi:hypothetical protein